MLKRIFEIDSRSLGLFRVLLGLLLVIYGAERFLAADVLYSDWGIMPRAYWISEYMGKNSFSFHLANGQVWFQRSLIGLQTITSLLYLIGYRSRLFGFITLVMLSSLQSRNNLILSCADDLIRMALLWSLFAPLDKSFSIISSTNQPAPRDYSLKTSWFNAALMLQLIYMYIFTAILKNHPIWISEGSAIYYALNIDIYAKPLGVWLRNFPEFMRLATFSTLIFEVVGPILALIPGWTRFLTSLAFIGFHMGLFLTLEIDYFPWIAALYWVVFWPSVFWNTSVGEKLQKSIEGIFASIRSASLKIPNFNLPSYKESKKNFSLEVICFVFLLLVTLYNINTVSKGRNLISRPILLATEILYLYQSWDMFAPYPIRNDGWFVIEGSFKSGKTMNLIGDKDITFEKPAQARNQYESGAMRKFMVNLWDKGNNKIILPYARFLCRKYSVENGQSSDLQYINIIFMKESTPPPGESFKPVENISLWNHDCFKN